MIAYIRTSLVLAAVVMIPAVAYGSDIPRTENDVKPHDGARIDAEAQARFWQQCEEGQAEWRRTHLALADEQKTADEILSPIDSATEKQLRYVASQWRSPCAVQNQSNEINKKSLEIYYETRRTSAIAEGCTLNELASKRDDSLENATNAPQSFFTDPTQIPNSTHDRPVKTLGQLIHLVTQNRRP